VDVTVVEARRPRLTKDEKAMAVRPSTRTTSVSTAAMASLRRFVVTLPTSRSDRC
jgi:hypothetical protein